MCIHTCIHTCILDPGSFVVDIICILPLDLLCWILDLGSCRCRCCKFWIFSLTHVGSYQSHCIGIGSFIDVAIWLKTNLRIDGIVFFFNEDAVAPGEGDRWWLGDMPKQCFGAVYTTTRFILVMAAWLPQSRSYTIHSVEVACALCVHRSGNSSSCIFCVGSYVYSSIGSYAFRPCRSMSWQGYTV